MLSFLPSFSTKSIEVKVIVLFGVDCLVVVVFVCVFCLFFLLLNLKPVKEILLDYHTENNLIVCTLHTLECNSGEELIDTCTKTFRHEKKRSIM